MFNGIIYNQGIITKLIKRPKGLNIFIKSILNVSKKDHLVPLSDAKWVKARLVDIKEVS